MSKEGWQAYVEMTHLPHTQAKRGKIGGVVSGQARLALSEEKREQARDLRAQGVKVADIATMLQVHRDTVYSWTK